MTDRTGWDYFTAIRDLNLGTDDEWVTLRPALKSVLMAYAARANAQGLTWPGPKRLRLDTGLGRSTVYGSRKRLIELGLIQVIDRRSPAMSDVVKVADDPKAIAAKWSPEDWSSATTTIVGDDLKSNPPDGSSPAHGLTRPADGLTSPAGNTKQTEEQTKKSSSKSQREKKAASRKESDDLGALREGFERVWANQVSSLPLDWSEVEPPIRRAMGWGFSESDVAKAMRGALAGDSSRYRFDERKQHPRYWLSSPDHIRDLIALAAEDDKKYANRWIEDEA